MQQVSHWEKRNVVHDVETMVLHLMAVGTIEMDREDLTGYAIVAGIVFLRRTRLAV